MEDIKQHGILHPVGVYIENKEYVLAYGNRRLQACKKLGWERIPSMVYETKLTDREFITINTSENIHRKDISPLELGGVCNRLHEMGLSLSEIGVRLSIPKSRAETALKLYSGVPDNERNEINFGKSGDKSRKGKIPSTTMSHIIGARLKKEDYQQLIDSFRKYDFSLAEIDLIIRLMKQGVDIKKAIMEKDKYIIKVLKFAFLREKVNEIEKNNSNISAYVRKILKKEGLIK
jgi:ParB/RepB/Spo0J family partition protein